MFALEEVKTPARIERWVPRMQVFDHTIEYKSGSENSRFPCSIEMWPESRRGESEERCRRLCPFNNPDSYTKSHET